MEPKRKNKDVRPQSPSKLKRAFANLEAAKNKNC